MFQVPDDEYYEYGERNAPDGEYVTRDSGQMAEHSDGVVRDKAEDKPRFDLLFPKGVPFEDQLITRVADLYERGAGKYGARNWEKSKSEDTLEHHEAALMRHVVRFLCGVEDGEDHAAAVVWNVNAVDLTRRKITQKGVEAAEQFYQDGLADKRTLLARKAGDSPLYDVPSVPALNPLTGEPMAKDSIVADLDVPVRRNFFDWLWEDGDAVFQSSRDATEAFNRDLFWRYDSSGDSPIWAYVADSSGVRRSPSVLVKVFGSLSHVDKHGILIKFDSDGNYVE